MPSKGRTDDQLFELMALGLSWVQAECSASPPPGWTGNGILHTLRFVGTITDQQALYLANKDRPLPDALRAHFTQRAQLIWPGRNGRPPRGEVTKQIASSNKPLIVVINTRMYDGNKIFWPGGYNLMMTNAGLRYAASIEPQWRRELTRDMFRGQWISHRRQMAGMNAAQGRRASTEG